MAKMIPAFGPLVTGSHGEKVLFEVIKEQLSDEFTVIHSLPWLSILINSATDSRDKTAKYSHAQAATDSHPKPAT